MVVTSVQRAEKIPGEQRFNFKPNTADLLRQYLVRRRIDCLWSASDDARVRPHAVLQPGGGAAGGMGGRRDDGNAHLRRDLRSVDWRMVGSHALAMGPAASVHVRLGGSCRGRILLPVRSAARMVAEPSPHLHGRDADNGASAAESL